MKIDLPQLHNFNKDKLAPSNEKLASFTVGKLPKNIMKPFMFISTSKLSVSYQKLRDRYEYLRRLEPLAPCEPLCQEGYYFDCATETCKEYSSYNLIPEVVVLTTKSISLDGVVTNLSLAGAYPAYPSIINVPSIGDVAIKYTLTLVGKATSRSFSVSKTITSAEEGYLGNAKDAGNNYMSADPWGDYWYNSFGTYEYSEVVELTIVITGSVEGVK